jgi:hypothetical protein
MAGNTVMMNRAPVLTLWAAVVAQRMGFDWEAALSLGKGLAGLNAQSKGRMLGIFGLPKSPERGKPPSKMGLGEEFWIKLCGRGIPAKLTEEGVRAVVRDKPIAADNVRKYLESKFGDALKPVTAAMVELAEAFPVEELEQRAYVLYERFRPEIPAGQRGWGAKGELDLDVIRGLAGGRGA